METPLSHYDDIEDAVADVMRCIDARLKPSGLQLKHTARMALAVGLAGVLLLAEVELRPDCLAVEEALAKEVA